MKPNMKKKFDFSAEMNEAESIKATPKNEYLEEEKRLLKENIKELASLNDNVHYIITNLDNLLEFLREYKVAIAQGTQEQAEKMSDIRGEVSDINFGNQIRSYVMQPYTMVKDHRTNAEISNVGAVMDGNIDPFINAYLSMDAEAQKGKKE